jgi:hypothetical protein
MTENSTLYYSIHNLASQMKHEIISCDDFAFEKQYQDVFDILSSTHTFDVRQEIVDNILDFAEHYSK